MLKPVLWQTLLELSELGAHKKAIKLSTKALGNRMGVSQQTVSRRLIELERLGRVVSLRGMKIKITAKGVEELNKTYLHLKKVIERASTDLVFDGIVFSGLGEGAYYITQRGYQQQFVSKLGFKPYPGTLNLEVFPSNLKMKEELESYIGIIIDGFKNGSRTFGPVRCYHTTINDEVKGAIIFIERTHHKILVLEVIAPICLRKTLNLKDGSKVWLKVNTKKML